MNKKTREFLESKVGYQVATDVEETVDELLTQQRTELLEEIKKEKQIKFKDIINSANMLLGMNGFRLTFDGEMLGLIDERLIKNTNLLNKKDE